MGEPSEIYGYARTIVPDTTTCATLPVTQAGPSRSFGRTWQIFTSDRSKVGGRLNMRFLRDKFPLSLTVRHLVKADSRGWTNEALTHLELVLADSLITLGEQKGQAQPLEEALRNLREMLQKGAVEDSQSQLSLVWNRCGRVLASLGEREPGAERLASAIIAFQNA